MKVNDAIACCLFGRKPPHESRVFFPEQELIGMVVTAHPPDPPQYTLLRCYRGQVDTGRYTLHLPPPPADPLADFAPWRFLADELAQATLRFHDWDTGQISVWKLTERTVHDDNGTMIWRLGVWPD